jgi:hypothetical protein
MILRMRMIFWIRLKPTFKPGSPMYSSPVRGWYFISVKTKKTVNINNPGVPLLHPVLIQMATAIEFYRFAGFELS